MSANYDAREEGEAEEVTMQVFDFTVKMTRLRRKAPSQSSVDDMTRMLLSKNLSKKRIEDKAQLVLSLFFHWPAALQAVNDRIVADYQERMTTRRKSKRATACRLRMRKKTRAAESNLRKAQGRAP